MTVDLLLPILAFGTMGAFAIFALISQNRTIARMNDPSAPKSSLARDRPDPALKPDVTETRKDLYPDEGAPAKM